MYECVLGTEGTGCAGVLLVRDREPVPKVLDERECVGGTAMRMVSVFVLGEGESRGQARSMWGGLSRELGHVDLIESLPLLIIITYVLALHGRVHVQGSMQDLYSTVS